MSPRKVRLLVQLIRGRRADDAVAELQFSHKTAARPLVKLLQSAIANAKTNHGLIKKTLVVKSASVDGGPIAYRYTPRAFGRATPVRRRTAHVMVVLEGEEGGVKSTAVAAGEIEGAIDAKKDARETKSGAKTGEKGGLKNIHATKREATRKVTIQRRSGG